MSDLLETARNAVKLAREKGANDAAASAHRSRDVELVWRDGKVEKVSEATSRGVSISLFVDGRYSAVSSSDLRPAALASFVEESIVMARTLAKDPHRGLPDPKLYEGRSPMDLQIFDGGHASVAPEDRLKLAKQLEAAARSVKDSGAIVSVTTSVWDSESRSARATSNGFEGENKSTSFWMDANVTAKDADGRRPDGYHSAGVRLRAELGDAEPIGRLAAERALAQIGARKIPSAVVPLIVENRVAGRLVRALLGPMNARSLQQKQSFLEGKLGSTIASRLLSITDDPHVPKGFGSRHYDSEGFASKKMSVVDAGVLKTFYVDDYYGRKLKIAPTTGSSSNLVFALGKKDLAALLGDVKDGVLVTAFLGGNSNGLTGDYSFGIQGFRIEKGVRTTPIAEMNISGNQKDLWKKLSAVGNDPYPYAALRSPSFVFDGVQFAGA